jgi:hypothetical protein
MTPGSQPPFPIEANLTDSASETELIVTVAGSKKPAKVLDNSREVLDVFWTAANAGMLGGARHSPLESHLHLSSSQTVGKEGVFRLAAKGIDAGSYRILINLFVQDHYGGETLTLLRLQSEPAPTAKAQKDLKKILAAPFPGRFSPLPFETSIDKDLADNEEPIIRVEFQRPIEDKEFEAINAWISAWESLIILKGFSTALEPVEELPMNPGELYMASPTVAEDTIFAFMAPVESFDSLINSAVKLHATVCPIVRLEIQ